MLRLIRYRYWLTAMVLEGSGRDLFQDVIPTLVVRTKECRCIRQIKFTERNEICI